MWGEGGYRLLAFFPSNSVAGVGRLSMGRWSISPEKVTPVSEREKITEISKLRLEIDGRQPLFQGELFRARPLRE
jgi:hypothetical protein